MKKTSIFITTVVFWVISVATYATTETTTKRRILSIPWTSSAIENVSADTSKPSTTPSKVIGGTSNQTVSSEEDDRVDPYGPIYSNTKYDFDKEKVTSYYETNKPKMYRVKCDKAAILSKLWFADEDIFSLWLNEWNYQVSYDLNNCSAWMSYTQQNNTANTYAEDKMVSVDNAYIMPYPYPSMNPIDEKTAISQAKSFVANNKVFDLIEKNLWEPVVRYRSYMDESTKKDLLSISILFPIIVNDTSVYYQYGDMAGISVEVNSNWVASANLSNLSMTLSNANSVVNWTDDIVNMIQRWWNNPYYGDWMDYGKQVNVSLASPEKVRLLVQRWSNYSAATATYLVSGIKMESDKKNYANWPDYEMVISDYKIWNTNSYPVY